MIHNFFTRRLILLALTLVCALPMHTSAQTRESQTLTVTPPLFQLSIAPGDLWQSSIKVVNGNAYPLTVYAEVVNFAAQGEAGQGRFIPRSGDDTGSSTLASWIELPKGPYVIPQEQTSDISFSVQVPKNAPPGGHFAAILISTNPPNDGSDKSTVQTSQVVTSLFFVRVEGDVIENGDIREFTTSHTFMESPETEFSLRFENKGNVLLQPRGNIVITNMWGSERGIIPVNNQSHFGNVLPQSIRNFRFTWSSDGSITDIGLFKAVVTLAYGEDSIKNTSSITYFWVIPVRATLMTLGILITFILLVMWMIKRYVRRMLTLAGIDPNSDMRKVVTERRDNEHDVRIGTYRAITKPIVVGASELKIRLAHVSALVDVFETLGGFIIQYKLFFGSILILIVGFIGVVFYINDATKVERNFNVTIHEGGTAKVINSEQILHDRQNNVAAPISTSTQKFVLELVNASGETGLAAKVASLLEDAGYEIKNLSTATNTIAPVTSVTENNAFATDTRALITTLQNGYGGKLNPTTTPMDEGLGTSTIRIMLGKDALVP